MDNKYTHVKMRSVDQTPSSDHHSLEIQNVIEFPKDVGSDKKQAGIPSGESTPILPKEIKDLPGN